MSTSRNRETAKIYQFPAGGRAALERRRELVAPTDASETAASVKIVYGKSWYHDEAVRDAEPSRKR